MPDTYKVTLTNAPARHYYGMIARYGEFEYTGTGPDKTPIKFVQRISFMERTLSKNFNILDRPVPVHIGHPDFDDNLHKSNDDMPNIGYATSVVYKEDGIYAHLSIFSGAPLELPKFCSAFWMLGANLDDFDKERNMQIAYPVLLKSIGLTNKPNIDVVPIELISSFDGSDVGLEADILPE